jgi:alpha-tubulin suppressor-like RCC1 family protein
MLNPVLSPTQLGTGISWQRVSVGQIHSCAVSAAGSTYCWGQNVHAQLGDGTFQARSAPTQVGTGVVWELVAAGSHHSCGIRAGALYCWGENALGQTGTGVTWSPIALSF